MEEKQLKKFLAGLCISGLVSGAGLTGTSCAQQGQSS
jgi:radical SAM modification target selenobiotic family peptide